MSQDKAMQAVAPARSEQKIHVAERARKAELMENMAVALLPVSTYQEKPPQRRGPVPQEPLGVERKESLSIAAAKSGTVATPTAVRAWHAQPISETHSNLDLFACNC